MRKNILGAIVLATASVACIGETVQQEKSSTQPMPGDVLKWGSVGNGQGVVARFVQHDALQQSGLVIVVVNVQEDGHPKPVPAIVATSLDLNVGAHVVISQIELNYIVKTYGGYEMYLPLYTVRQSSIRPSPPPADGGH